MRYTQLSPTLHRLEIAGLVLRFEYRVDRWAHAISVVSPGLDPARAELVLLSSHEGRADDSAPPSPAFQDLRFEPISLATVLASPTSGSSDEELTVGEFQLFGQCGRQVYSAAVRCTAGQIDFDLCVRVRGGEPYQLSSSYDCAPLASAENGVPLIGGQLRLETIPISNEPVLSCRDEPRDRITLATEPVTLPIKKSQTLRWAYRLTWDA